VVSTPLKNMKVSWDDYFQYMEKYKMFQTTNQYNYIQRDYYRYKIPFTIWLFNIAMEKSLINEGFNGKIIYKWAIFHGYVK